MAVDENGEAFEDTDKVLGDLVELIFSGRIPSFLFYTFQEILRDLVFYASLVYPTAGCTAALKREPENDYILQHIENEKFDVIISDPIDLAEPLLSWKYKISLAYNARWTLTDDAGQALTGNHNSLISNGFGTTLGTNHFTFTDRVYNVIHSHVQFIIRKVFAYKLINHALTEWNYPYSHDFLINSQADLWLLRFNFLLEVPRPMMPNQLAVGGFKCGKGKPVCMSTSGLYSTQFNFSYPLSMKSFFKEVMVQLLYRLVPWLRQFPKVLQII